MVLNVSCLTMLSTMLRVTHRASETWVEHFTRKRRQARTHNEEAGHELWGPLALKRQLTFAGHIARLGDDRMAKCVSIAHGIETWRTTQAIIEHSGGRGRAFRHTGRGVAPCVWDQNPQRAAERWYAGLTESQKSEWIRDHGCPPQTWWDMALQRQQWWSAVQSAMNRA